MKISKALRHWVMLVFAALAVAGPQVGLAQQSEIDPVAIQLLRRSTDHVAAQKQFRVDTETLVEVVLTTGQKLQHLSSGEMAMYRTVKSLLLGASAAVLLLTGNSKDAPLKLALVGEASAIVGVAPGGSVVRRRAIAGTAVVASTTANASAAVAANAAAATAQQPRPAEPEGPPPIGTMVAMLPPGCTPTKLNGVDYQRCGSTYYAVALQGSTVVFVVAQP